MRFSVFVAFVIGSISAHAQTAPVTPVQAERQFVERMADTFTQQDAAPTPVPAAPTPAPSAPEPVEEAPSPPEPPPAEDAETPVTDPPDKVSETDEEPATEEEEDEIDEEFAAAAKVAKVALTADDLPEEARPLFKKRVKELEAMATRATMDARSYRKEEAAFRAEQRFQAEHRAAYVADLLLKHPELGDEVNVIIEGLTTETAKQAHEIVVKDKRAKALDATNTELNAKAERVNRGLALDSYTRSSAMKAGVPMELGVEASVIAHINQHGDISERDIDAIVSQKAKEYENHTRAIRREASKKYAAGKVEARATAGLKVKPGSGLTPAPAGKPRAKSDAEFVDAFVGKM